jgi:aminoglycoside phosphotransferase (APT) family kinase protein
LLESVRALASPAPALLHLDYHPLNVLVSGRQVTGVLDWANAAAGDPRLDVARTATILRLTPTPPGESLGLTKPIRRTFARGWRHGYQQAGGHLDDLPVFFAAAGAIMERDLAPKVGRPGIPLEERHLVAMRAWTARWKRRAGLTDELG